MLPPIIFVAHDRPLEGPVFPLRQAMFCSARRFQKATAGQATRSEPLRIAKALTCSGQSRTPLSRDAVVI